MFFTSTTCLSDQNAKEKKHIIETITLIVLMTSFSAMNFGCPSQLDAKGDEKNNHAKSHLERFMAPFSLGNILNPVNQKICAIDLDFDKIREDFRFIKEEVIFEDLYVPLQEDVTNLWRIIEEKITDEASLMFPDETSIHNPGQERLQTTIGLSESCENETDTSNMLVEGLEFEGYEIVPRITPDKIMEQQSKPIHPHVQHASNQNTVMQEKKRLKVRKKRITKGLGKNQPKTIYVEKLNPRNSQDSLAKELQRKQHVSRSRSG